MRELSELRTNPPDGIRVVVNEDNMLDVTGIVEGPGTSLPRCVVHPNTPLTRRATRGRRGHAVRGWLL